MGESALEEMEAGGVMKSNYKNGSRRFWRITLLCSAAVMAISLFIFCLNGKANNMEASTSYTVKYMGRYLILQYALFGAMDMLCGRDDSPPQEIDPADMALLEQAVVVFICIVTLLSGKIVEVFIYTMSFITGLVSLSQLSSPTPTFGKSHLWLIMGVGTVTGLICLIPILFFVLGWFSIFILTYVFIVRFNFPDKTLAQVFPLVSEVLATFFNSCRSTR